MTDSTHVRRSEFDDGRRPTTDDNTRAKTKTFFLGTIIDHGTIMY
jgi:hypothetical protein